MTYFPHPPAQYPAITPTAATSALTASVHRDILWNQPIFKAPTLTNPRGALDPLPFTATRLVRRRSLN